MNGAPFFSFDLYSVEEPGVLHIGFKASNGLFSGYAELYCTDDSIIALGKALQSFPAHVHDEQRLEIGTDDFKENFYLYFLLRAHVADAIGHCALQIVIRENPKVPDISACQFSIPTEAAPLNRLGWRLEEFGARKVAHFRWSPLE